MTEEKTVFTLASDVRSPSFIATADVHLGKKLYNMPELEEDMKDNLIKLSEIVLDKKVDYLVIAGDLFENNECVKAHTITFVQSIVEKLRKNGTRTVGIAGDHDKPVKKQSWVTVCDIEPVTIEPAFAGVDWFDYSTTTVEGLVNLLKDRRDCSKVLWLFLHCQFPQVFERSEPKKQIDYNQLNLFKNFPNLQGLVAGDLHFAPEATAYGVGHEAYVGYPGSLGINDRSEFEHNKHVLYCDGKTLRHLPFPVIRTLKEIDFRDKNIGTFDVAEHVKWAEKQTAKPIFYIHYDSNSDNHMFKLTPLYQVGFVKLNQVPIGTKNPNDVQVVSSRSEMSSDDKVNRALQYYCKEDKELFRLSAALLKDDPKDVLDKFKAQYKL